MQLELSMMGRRADCAPNSNKNQVCFATPLSSG